MDILRKIKDLALSDGFDRVERLGEWEGYDLFLADTDEPCAIGLPQYILSAGKEARWASVDETMRIMAAMS